MLSFDEIITAARRYKMPITSVRRHEIDKLKKKGKIKIKIKITKEQGGDHTVIFFLFFRVLYSKKTSSLFENKISTKSITF